MLSLEIQAEVKLFRTIPIKDLLNIGKEEGIYIIYGSRYTVHNIRSGRQSQ